MKRRIAAGEEGVARDARPGVVTLTDRRPGRQRARRPDDSRSRARKRHQHSDALLSSTGLSTYGGCRLCLVEVEGSSKLLPACTTKVAEGMEVAPPSPRLQNYRRMILEMLFAERNHVCSVCVSNGHCELQWLAQNLGVDHIRFRYHLPEAAGGRQPRPLRAGSEPLHSVHALRAGLRRDRRRAHLGRDGARRRIAGDHRSGAALGRIAKAAPVAASACRCAPPAR